jgi:hypothetical protein
MRPALAAVAIYDALLLAGNDDLYRPMLISTRISVTADGRDYKGTARLVSV